MKSLISPFAIVVVCAVAMSGSDGWPGMKNLPRLPGARLLVGYPGDTLMVTSPETTWTIAQNDPPNVYLPINPTMSRDGNLIATALMEGAVSVKLEGDSIHVEMPISIATYSLQERQWAVQKHLRDAFEGSIAIAEDGSALAFAVAEWDGKGNPVAQTMHVIYLKSGAERRYPIKGRHGGITVSWSPDGRHIVYDTHPKRPYEGATEYSPEILILDLETGESRKVTTGNEPAWSPSGEWIAYYYSPEAARVKVWSDSYLPPRPTQVMLVRPDGTGARLLAKDKYFMAPPVWLPDSKTILLSTARDFINATMDIKRVDIATRKVSPLVKRGPPVFGWAKAN